METNRHISPNLQIPGQEDWARCVHGAGDHHPHPHNSNMGSYMEHNIHQSQGYFPNYCYGPYPPPSPTFVGYGPAMYMGVQPLYMPMMGVSYFVPSNSSSSNNNNNNCDQLLYESKPGDAMSRASRKCRIARRRVHENEEHQPRAASSAVLKPHAACVARKQENNVALHNPPVLAASAAGQQGVQRLDSKDLMFLLAKQLSPSGVSSLGRIVLPKKEAEAHLPNLVASEGLLLTMEDFDTRNSWTFRYRFWSNNKSRMYVLENTRDFVKAHNLQERDMLVLYKDAEGSYVVRGEKNGTGNQTSGDIAVADHEAPTTEEEISRKNQTFEFLI